MMRVIFESRYVKKDLGFSAQKFLISFCMFLRAIRNFDLYFKKIFAMAVDQVRENLEEGRLIRKILQYPRQKKLDYKIIITLRSKLLMN